MSTRQSAPPPSRGATPAYVRGSTPAARGSPAPEPAPITPRPLGQSGQRATSEAPEVKKADTPSEKAVPASSSSTSATDTKAKTSDAKTGPEKTSTTGDVDKTATGSEAKPEGLITETGSSATAAGASAVVSTSTSDEPPIDMDIFSQILEMDEGDEPEEERFSVSIVTNYFEQAEATFEKMSNALDAKNLKVMSELGHFLKGSSAALGIWKVQSTCESLQHAGVLKDYDHVLDPQANGAPGKGGRNRTKSGIPKELTREEALAKCATLMEQLRGEYAEGKKWLKDFVSNPQAA